LSLLSLKILFTIFKKIDNIQKYFCMFIDVVVAVVNKNRDLPTKFSLYGSQLSSLSLIRFRKSDISIGFVSTFVILFVILKHCLHTITGMTFPVTSSSMTDIILKIGLLFNIDNP